MPRLTPNRESGGVLSSTAMVATVTTKKKGRAGADNVWDVRVGTGILVNGFTVQP